MPHAPSSNAKKVKFSALFMLTSLPLIAVGIFFLINLEGSNRIIGPVVTFLAAISIAQLLWKHIQ